MIRGNETAIDLALDVLAAERPGEAVSQVEIAAYIDAAREILGLPTKRFRQNDLFFLEQRALKRMRQACERQRESDKMLDALRERMAA
jgi:hypothetical protein